jgi:NAD(P)-dependent dehydrogenase (short-subunit alcohol dehydrogenase family)
MRVSIITGGGIGIGAAVARRLAGPDQCLMLHGQGTDEAGLERLKAVGAGCERAGAKALGTRSISPMPARPPNSSSRRDRRSAASMQSCMPRALPIDAVLSSCRAQASNGRSP